MTNYIIKTKLHTCPAIHYKKKRKKITFWCLFVLLILFLYFTIIAPFMQWHLALDIFGFNKDILQPKNYYILYVPMTNTNNEKINDEIEQIKLRGGAGNLVTFKNQKAITLGAYINIEQAKAVQNNLSNQDISCEIFTHKIQKINLKKYSKNEKELQQNCYKFFIELIENIYNLIIGFDKGNYNESDLEKNINLYYTKSKIEINKLLNLFEYEDNYFYKVLLQINSILAVLCNKSYIENAILNISCEFKYNLINIIMLL